MDDIARLKPPRSRPSGAGHDHHWPWQQPWHCREQSWYKERVEPGCHQVLGCDNNPQWNYLEGFYSAARDSRKQIEIFAGNNVHKNLLQWITGKFHKNYHPVFIICRPTTTNDDIKKLFTYKHRWNVEEEHEEALGDIVEERCEVDEELGEVSEDG